MHSTSDGRTIVELAIAAAEEGRAESSDVKNPSDAARSNFRAVDLIAELLRRGGVIPPRRIRDARAKIDDEFRKLTPEQLAAARAVFVPATVKPSDATYDAAAESPRTAKPSAVHPDDAEREVHALG